MGKNRKSNNMSTYEKMYYTCSICRQEHLRSEICPIMHEKMLHHRKRKKDNFLMGNILLECMKQDVNIFDLLYEISYIAEVFTERKSGFGYVNAELLIDYCSQELRINSKRFYKRPEDTICEILKLCDWIEYRDTYISEEEGNYEIIFECEMELPKSKYAGRFDDFSGYLVKERIGEKNWCYKVYLDCPHIFINGRTDENKHKYFFGRVESASKDILLIEDFDGELAEKMEREIDYIWEDVAGKIPLSDERFQLWINKLLQATIYNKLSWSKQKRGYITKYGDIEINIGVRKSRGYIIHSKSKGSMVNRDIYHQISIRFEDKYAIRFEICLDKNEKEVEKMNELITLLEKFQETRNKLIEIPNIEIKNIDFSDVLVVSSSMICKTNEHNIVPYKGIVKILTEENIEIEYSIYVGYCRECCLYYVFNYDFERMIQQGKPLCAVYFYEEIEKGKKQSSFAYKSQSILAARGYNVQANSELTEEGRHEILKD